ncbi:porin [Pseudooceanicola nanhaiensis]|uniref:porin n=1 Tax=Pseudooceanicola nanhaiensis TaxID=375761 RepID=UPI001CD6F86E|nr:porin [Pseudooceanicola nanhaiensis]MCA0918864.1 porin [Pseudooceanicola nanhaiensis]
MKKILFASTALALTAGAAAAETSIAGYGRFGVVYDESKADETYIEQRFQLTFTGTTTADNGLVFGGKMRIRSQESGDVTLDSTANAAQMFIKTGGLTLEVGNVDWALDNMPGASFNTTIGLQNFWGPSGIDAYSSRGASNTGVAVIYSMAGFTGHISYDVVTEDVDGYVSYETGGYTFALGASDYDSGLAPEWILTAGGTVGMVDFSAGYTGYDNYGFWSLYGGADVGAATEVRGFLAYDDGAEEWGVGADFEHDLGGGAALTGGVFNMYDITEADLGVTFSF